MVNNKARYPRTAAYLLCRTVGHAWFPIPANYATYGDPMWFRCERCDCERRDEVGGGGKLLKRIYVYKEGYRGYFQNTFEEAPTRSDYRLMLLQQAIIKSRDKRAQQENGRSTK